MRLLSHINSLFKRPVSERQKEMTVRVPHNMSAADTREKWGVDYCADGRLFQTFLSTFSTIQLQPVNVTGQHWLFRKGLK